MRARRYSGRWTSFARLAELSELVGADVAEKALAFIGATGSAGEIIDTLEALAGGADGDTQRLRTITSAIAELGLGDVVTVDPSITRGLDYYTGVVFETFLDGAEQIGSVCSGGRYDDLVSLYSKEEMPGVGASIGLDRLIAALDELQTTGETQRPAEILIAMQDPALLVHYHRIAGELRAHGVRCEVYPDARKLGRFGELICCASVGRKDTRNDRIQDAVLRRDDPGNADQGNDRRYSVAGDQERSIPPRLLGYHGR
jgi:histidyl-tRNA synthetase